MELNVPWSVRQALGDGSAVVIPEARSCVKSDTRQLYFRQQLQRSVRTAPRSRKGEQKQNGRSRQDSRGAVAAAAFEVKTTCGLQSQARPTKLHCPHTKRSAVLRVQMVKADAAKRSCWRCQRRRIEVLQPMQALVIKPRWVRFDERFRGHFVANSVPK